MLGYRTPNKNIRIYVTPEDITEIALKTISGKFLAEIDAKNKQDLIAMVTPQRDYFDFKLQNSENQSSITTLKIGIGYYEWLKYKGYAEKERKISLEEKEKTGIGRTISLVDTSKISGIILWEYEELQKRL